MVSTVRYPIDITAKMSTGYLDTFHFTIKDSSGLQIAIVFHEHLILDGESGSQNQTIVSTEDKLVRRFRARLHNF